MIYLDHAAATPVTQHALEAMQPYFSERFFNPSAPYLPAKQVHDEYEAYKNRLAHLIGAKGNDLIVTSGATEANNLAFTASAGKVLILATEHDSIFAVAKNRDYETIKVDHTGRIDLADFTSKLQPDIAFVSVALVNGELGTIQPLAEIAELIKKERFRRLENGEELPIYLHSDASQALGLLNISVSRLGVDLLTLNSAKIGGPKGVGALYLAHGVKLQPLSYGGGQERGLRAGTENVAGLAGFAVAAEEAQSHLVFNRKKYANLTEILRHELLKSPVQPLFLGSKNHQLANFCPISFSGIDAERLIYLLEDDGIYVSTGAACAASKGEKSKTLKAIGLSDIEIAGSLRLSLGSTNNEAQIRTAAAKICAAIAKECKRLKLL